MATLDELIRSGVGDCLLKASSQTYFHPLNHICGFLYSSLIFLPPCTIVTCVSSVDPVNNSTRTEPGFVCLGSGGVCSPVSGQPVMAVSSVTRFSSPRTQFQRQRACSTWLPSPGWLAEPGLPSCSGRRSPSAWRWRWEVPEEHQGGRKGLLASPQAGISSGHGLCPLWGWSF